MKPASPSRTSRAASRSGARNESLPLREEGDNVQRTNFWFREMIVRSTKREPEWLSGE